MRRHSDLHRRAKQTRRHLYLYAGRHAHNPFGDTHHSSGRLNGVWRFARVKDLNHRPLTGIKIVKTHLDSARSLSRLDGNANAIGISALSQDCCIQDLISLWHVQHDRVRRDDVSPLNRAATLPPYPNKTLSDARNSQVFVQDGHPMV